MPGARLHNGYLPGAIGRMAELHGAYYAKHWRFGMEFEALVATEIAAFAQRFDSGNDGWWTLSQDGRVEASIVLDAAHGQEHSAHLRWFIVSDTARGSGAGRRLLSAALEHGRHRQFGRIILNTFAGLDAARHLYESVGFTLTAEHAGSTWGTPVSEQRFELDLTSGPASTSAT